MPAVLSRVTREAVPRMATDPLVVVVVAVVVVVVVVVAV